MRITLRPVLSLACLAALASCDRPATLSAPDAPNLSTGGPAAPTGVQASANVNGAVRVVFSHDGVGVTHFNFYRRNNSISPSSWVLVRATDNVGLRAYGDKAYDPQYPSWQWQVEACNATACTPGPVATLTNLRIGTPEELTFGPGDTTRVDLHWDDPWNESVWHFSTNHTAPGWAWSYLVTRTGPDGSVAHFSVPAAAAVTHFADTTVVPHTTYRYNVRARNVVGSGSATYEVTVLAGGPAPPAGVTAQLQETGSVLVSWVHDGAGVQRWYVDGRPHGATAWQEQRIVYGTTRSVAARYHVADDAWEWRVRACSSSYRGLACNAAASNVLEGLRVYAPTNPRLLANEIRYVRLGWDLGRGPVYRTNVYRRVEGSTQLVKLGSALSPRVAYADTTARPWLRYHYSFSSANNSGETGRTGDVAVGPWDTVSYQPPTVYTDSVRRTGMEVRVYGRALGTRETPTTGWFEISASSSMANAEKTHTFAVSSTTLTAYFRGFWRSAGTYYVRMAAQSERGTTYGPVLQFTETAPAPPAEVTAVTRTDGGVAVRWTHSGQNVYRWVLYRRARGTTLWTAQVRSSTTNTVRLLVDYGYSGDPGGYEWKVDACTAAGVCASSAPAAL